MQKIYIGSDHRGFQLKEELKSYLQRVGCQITDVGNQELNVHDDYVEFARVVSESVVSDAGSFGIVICGSGVGVTVVANKVKGARCALITNKIQAEHARASDDCNIIAVASDYTVSSEAQTFVTTFLSTPFKAEERMVRRLSQITQVENNQ